VVFDGNGNIYIADRSNNRIRRVAANGTITTVAGGGQYGPGGSVGDGGPGTQAVLYSPSQVDTDSNGNVYVADTNHHRIRMLQAGTFTISTVAGTGVTGWTGDGGAATAATLFNTWGVAATTPGTFWLSQSVETAVSQQSRVRKVTSGIIQTAIGGGLGSGGAAVNALVDPRGGEAVDAGGVLPDLYFADGTNNVVRRVAGDTGIIDTIAGTGVAGYSGDGGSAFNATLRTPFDVAVDAANGTVYVADTFNNVIRKLSHGIITTAAGSGPYGYSGEARQRRRICRTAGIDVDRFGTLFIADTDNNRIRRVSRGQISTVAGNGSRASWRRRSGDQRHAEQSSDVAVADDDTLYVADAQNNRIRRVTPAVHHHNRRGQRQSRLQWRPRRRDARPAERPYLPRARCREESVLR
jgi:sugar lactone lactonase YvrE